MPIRTFIVDDMLLARNRVRRHLESEPDVEIIGEASGGEQAIAAIRELRPDLVFLDVQMPEVGGFDVLEAVGPAAMTCVIFVTAHDQFALKAFEVHALDYLLKPFDEARFRAAMRRARAHLAAAATANVAGRLQSLLADLGGQSPARRLAIKADGRMLFLPVDEIDYVEAAGNYLRIVAGSQSHMIREKIGEMEQRLAGAGFARIHRSTLVNLERIKEMHPLFNGDQTAVLRGGKQLTVSRTYREAVLKLLDSMSS